MWKTEHYNGMALLFKQKDFFKKIKITETGFKIRKLGNDDAHL